MGTRFPPRKPGRAGEETPVPPDPYSTALRMLGRRELSRRQLRDRLLARGADRDAVEAALERLAATGAVDDTRVARSYARTAAQVKGRGRDRIERELGMMGIDAATARAALDDVCGVQDEHERLSRALARKARNVDLADHAAVRKLFASLMRQGFDADAIRKALRQAGGDED